MQPRSLLFILQATKFKARRTPVITLVYVCMINFMSVPVLISMTQPIHTTGGNTQVVTIVQFRFDELIKNSLAIATCFRLLLSAD